jgi:glycosyltransferase involved in cell wall biosynthesis
MQTGLKMEDASNRPMRGIVFAKYGDRAASTRQRFAQYRSHLAAANITLDIYPLFDNTYLEALFTKGMRSKTHTFLAYLHRLRDLLRIGSYDFIMVQYELFPYLPAPFEALLRLTKKPVVYDIDDAIFHQYDAHKNPRIRSFLGGKLHPIMKRADLALCGNTYLADYVSRFSKRTEIVPTVVDTDNYRTRPTPETHAPITVGWMGSPSTWDYCLPMTDMLSENTRAGRLSFLAVGAEHKASDDFPFTFRAWEESREVADIHDMDIGIMPIPDAPWARGKCGYKLIQYMACGLPVIASPVGVNRDIVTHGVNGFLASSEAEWREAITTLATHASLRARMGEEGRKRVVERYSLQAHGPRVAQLLRALSSQL